MMKALKTSDVRLQVRHAVVYSKLAALCTRVSSLVMSVGLLTCVPRSQIPHVGMEQALS